MREGEKTVKKIFFMINSLSGGGAEKVLIDLLNSLDFSKYEVDLLTITGGVYEERVTKKVNYKKIIKKPNSFLGRLLQRLVYHMPKSLFRKLFVRKNYDVEIAYLEGFPTRVVAKSKSKKIAFVHCDVSVKPILQGIYKNDDVCKKEYESFDKVCFVSKSALVGFEKIFGKLSNATVVHNVINAEEIQNKAKEKNEFTFNTNGLKIISVGRLSSEKGYERLVRIASKLEKKYDFELCILGEGAERSRLEEIIKAEDSKAVRLLGFQKNPYSYMKKADLYVCPSFFEGYSTTVTECMILGVPVLTTDCAGMEEILKEGKYGMIVDNDEAMLEKGIIRFLEDKNILETYRQNIKKCKINDNVKEFLTVVNELI